MKQSEFEKLTGLTLTNDEFAEINRIYHAIDDIIKPKDFSECWRKFDNRTIFDKLVGKIEKLKKFEKLCDKMEANLNTAALALLEAANKYNDEDLKSEAICDVGLDAVVRMDIKYNFKLNEEERDYILQELNNSDNNTQQ